MVSTLRVQFTKVTGEELKTVTVAKHDEFGNPIDLADIIEAGKRYIRESTIGYSGAIRVRVR